MNGYFYLNGKSSREFNVWLSESDGSTGFGVQSQSSVELLPNSFRTYIMEPTYEALKLQLRIWSEQPLTREKRIEMCRWLFKNGICELFTEDEMDIVYFGKLTGNPNRFIAADESGYIDVEMICDSPCVWSRPMVQNYDLISEAQPTFPLKFQIRNDSNYENWYRCKFYIWIPPDTTDDLKDLKFTIWNRRNTYDEADAFTISSALGSYPLQKGERLEINMSDKRIDTNLNHHHRITNCNRKFIDLDFGVNEIEFTGNCELRVLTQHLILM